MKPFIHQQLSWAIGVWHSSDYIMGAPDSTNPSPTATPASAPSKPLNPSHLSLHTAAAPFFPSSQGRTKSQRWLESPCSDGDATKVQQIRHPSYRDVVAGLDLSTPEDDGWLLRAAATPPPQPPRARVRSEIHKISGGAAPDDEGWREVRSRRSRWRHRHHGQQPETQQPDRRKLLAALEGSYFNCLGKGHFRQACREPTRCIRCKRPNQRSFECRRPDPRRLHQPKQTTKTPGSLPSQRVATGGNQTSSATAAGGTSQEQQQPRQQSHGRWRRGCRGGGRRWRPQDLISWTLVDPLPHLLRLRSSVGASLILERTEDTDQWEATNEYLGIMV